MLGSRPSFKTKNRPKIRLLCAGPTRRVINLMSLRLSRTRLVLVLQYSADMPGGVPTDIERFPANPANLKSSKTKLQSSDEFLRHMPRDEHPERSRMI